MKNRLLAVAAVFAVSVSCSQADDSISLSVERPEVAAFIDEMVREHQFDRNALTETLSQARVKQSILDKISTPAEKKLTWSEYRKIFLTKERIRAGMSFWQENQDMLDRIYRETGVPVEMIVLRPLSSAGTR